MPILYIPAYPPPRFPTRAELLAEIHRVADENGLTPTSWAPEAKSATVPDAPPLAPDPLLLHDPGIW